MKIDEIKDIIDSKKYKSFELGYNEYYIVFNKDLITYVSYIGVFETHTLKINRFFRDFRLGIYYNTQEFLEIISKYHFKDYITNKIKYDPRDLYEIINKGKPDIYFTETEEKTNTHKTNKNLFYAELNSSMRKNKLLKINQIKNKSYIKKE